MHVNFHVEMIWFSTHVCSSNFYYSSVPVFSLHNVWCDFMITVVQVEVKAWPISCPEYWPRVWPSWYPPSSLWSRTRSSGWSLWRSLQPICRGRWPVLLPMGSTDSSAWETLWSRCCMSLRKRSGFNPTLAVMSPSNYPYYAVSVLLLVLLSMEGSGGGIYIGLDVFLGNCPPGQPSSDCYHADNYYPDDNFNTFG